MSAVRNLIESLRKEREAGIAEYRETAFENSFKNNELAMAFITRCRSYINFLNNSKITKQQVLDACDTDLDRDLVGDFFLILKQIEQGNSFTACMVYKASVERYLAENPQ